MSWTASALCFRLSSPSSSFLVLAPACVLLGIATAYFGGSALNTTLLRAIERHGNVAVRTTEDYGVPVQAREAIAMGLLGLLALDGVPITLPAVTGCDPTISTHLDGSWLLPRSVAPVLSAMTTHETAHTSPV